MKWLARESKKRELPLILYTHIPLHKDSPNCVDKPMTNYDRHQIFLFVKFGLGIGIGKLILLFFFSEGYVIEQNMLSVETSNFILNELKPVFIFTGHDHYGCKYEHNSHTTEFTIRSMMGDFDGTC